MKEHALIYLGLGKNNKKTIDDLLTKMNFDVTYIDDHYLNNKIIDLFNQDNRIDNNEHYLFDFILCKNINHDNVMTFYKLCKEEGIPFSHKAVLTQHNLNWTLEQLLNEINEEHNFFVSWNKLYALLKDANECNPKDYDEESFKLYQNAFIKGYMYTKQKDPNKIEVDLLIEEITNTKSMLKKC